MFDSTVNELSKYVMADHTDGNEKLDLLELITFSKKSFHEDQPIHQAAKVLVKEGHSGFPVVNSKGELVGFLSEKDCLCHIFDDALNKMPSGKVKDYMSKELITVTPTTALYKVVEYFISKPFHSYPVLDEGKYVGYIRRKDLLKALIGRGFNL